MPLNSGQKRRSFRSHATPLLAQRQVAPSGMNRLETHRQRCPIDVHARDSRPRRSRRRLNEVLRASAKQCEKKILLYRPELRQYVRRMTELMLVADDGTLPSPPLFLSPALHTRRLSEGIAQWLTSRLTMSRARSSPTSEYSTPTAPTAPNLP
jgi:hypothetical protein